MSLLAQMQFWTLKNSIFIKDNNVGVFKIHDKNENSVSGEHPYLEEKEAYATSRGITWTPKNKQFKLRDSLKDLEETFLSDRCVAMQWVASGLIQLFFNSGLLVSLHLAADDSTICKITTDRYLCGKLATDHVSDMIRLDNMILICYNEAKLTYIYFSKKPKRLDKLSGPDLHIVTIDLEGPPMQRFDRRLSLNSNKDSVLLWWSARSNEVKPWMPTSSDRDRANLIVYALNSSSMELLCYAQTDGDIVSATFSSANADQVITIEEHVSNKKKVSVNICTYHVSRGRFLRTSQTMVPLQGHIVCCQWSNQEERLVLACSDMSVIMYNSVRQVTRLTMAHFVPVEVAWHPNGSIVFVASEKGNLQCFDIGLTSVKLQLKHEEFLPNKKLEISSYFKSPPLILRLLWEKGEKSNKMCLLFDKGPLAMLELSLGVTNKGQLGPLELIVEYLKEDHVDDAISVLHCLNWVTDADVCFKCMTVLVNWLLKKPLNHDREAQLEAALGSFYDTSHPLPDLIVEEYRQRMGHLARRFFHLLLRYERLEKAFLLAVDLGCRDLFMDLHHIALAKKEIKLAEVALQRVDQFDNQSMVSRNYNSESTEEETSELSEEDHQAAQQLNNSDPPLIHFSPDNDVNRELKRPDQSVRPKIPLPSRLPPEPPNLTQHQNRYQDNRKTSPLCPEPLNLMPQQSRCQDNRKTSPRAPFPVQMATSFQTAIPSTTTWVPKGPIPMQCLDTPPAIPPRRDVPYSPTKPSPSASFPSPHNLDRRYCGENSSTFRHNANNNHLSSLVDQYNHGHSSRTVEHIIPSPYSNPNDRILDEDETEDARIHFEHFGIV